MQDSKSEELVAQEEPSGQLELFSEMAALERERIASSDRRTEAMRETMAQLNAIDERQFRFHTDKLHKDDAFRNRRFTLNVQMAWIFAIVVVVTFLGLLVVGLWGSEAQQDTAVGLLQHALSAVAFFGIGFFVGRRDRN